MTVDVIVRRKINQSPHLLLIRRKHEPFEGQWALPGGFVDEGEDLPNAAARELFEETGVKTANLTQLAAFGKPGRDPRHHTVSVVYYTEVGHETDAVAGDDAAEADWFPLDRLPTLAFDHADIIRKYREVVG